MKLSEVKIYPRVYNVIETLDSRFTVGGEIKVCNLNKDLVLVAVGSGLAFFLTKDEASFTQVESR
jgi:hypothetical protein